MEAELERMDRIYIKDLLLRCIIGINKDEREKRQDVIINLVLYADLSAAGRNDRIDDTVNYKSIKNSVVALVEDSRYYLVEKLAEEIAQTCLQYAPVRAVRVMLEKPGALRFARSVGIEIVRRKEPHRPKE